MPTADHVDISVASEGKAPVGSRVTVRGWVRTRRDSKAGLSFIHVHDGSCFDPIQVVAPAHAAQLRERDQEADVGLRGRSRPASLAQSQGQGQAVEVQAERVEVVGWVDDPETYPIQPKQTRSSTCARSRTCGRAPTRSARSRACATASAWRSTATSTSTASSGSTRRSSRPATPKAPARCSASARSTSPTCGAIPRTPDGRIDFTQDFFGKEAFLTVSGQLNVETYCLRAVEGLHVRPDVPRREQQHQPPPRRVLDDRAGDRVRRSRRRRRPRRGVPQVHLHGAAERARRRHEVLRRAHRQGLRRAPRGVRRRRRSSA